MTRVHLRVAEHPVVAVVLVAALTVLLAVPLPTLRVDESGEGLMVENDPARAFYEDAKHRFGSDNLTVVLVQADDVFTPRVLAAVARLSQALARVDGVTRVESLATVKNLRGDGDVLDTEPLLGAVVPTDPVALAHLRRDALGNRVFAGNLVAADARATAIALYTEARPADPEFNHRFADAVDALIARERAPGLTIFQTGAPLTRSTYTRSLRADLRTLIPLSVAGLLATLFIAFRMLQGVVIPALTAAVSVVWTLGLMALADIPINILTSILPSLLLAIGFTEDVHMLAAYHERLARGDEKLAAIRAMVRDGAMPIFVTTATTVLGFGSLVLTDITVLIEFGWASAMGLTANYVATVLLLPVLLRAWPVPRRLRGAAFADAPATGRLSRAMAWLGDVVLRRRRAVCVGWGLLLLASAAGWASLRVDTDLIAYFPASSVIRTRMQALHEALAGGFAFYVVVDTGRPDGAKDPAVLDAVARLQQFLEGTGKVDKTVSLADYVRRMHREMHGGDPALEIVPADADLVAQYLLTLDGAEVAKLVDFETRALNVVVRHNLSGSGELGALLRRLDEWTAANVPAPWSVRATGEGILFNNASDFMAVNEVTSFTWTFAVIALIHAALFRSVKAGLLSLVPNVVPVLCLFGVMGALGIPLNTATALVATIAIGIAVDDTVHHMMTYHRRLDLHRDPRRATIETLRAEARPIICVSLALAAGFLTLTASSFASTRQFGALSAFVMLLAMAGELMLGPLVMSYCRPTSHQETTLTGSIQVPSSAPSATLQGQTRLAATAPIHTSGAAISASARIT